jgi:hypothetical protein
MVSKDSIEFAVICAAAGPNPDYAQIAKALKRALDWDRLLDLAAAHGVRPQLIQAFQRLDWTDVPLHTKRSLLTFLTMHAARSLLLAKELIIVNDLFSKNAIRFAAFKGASLSRAIYGDISFRESNDIDVIVEKEQLLRAESVLVSMGYRAVYASSSFRDAFLSHTGQCVLVREDRQIEIDLHWDFGTSYAPFPLSSAEIWHCLEQVEIGGRFISTLNQTDLTLFLAGHGTKEKWRCLKWVADFAMLLEKRAIDWMLVLDRAKRNGCGRSILVGCQLAAELLRARVDRDFLRTAKDDVQARLMAELLMRSISSEYPIPASERELGDFDLCETKSQRVWAIGKLLVTRTAGDYVSMPLPRSLWPMYYVTRPFRLAGKAIKSVDR